MYPKWDFLALMVAGVVIVSLIFLFVYFLQAYEVK